ncbi:oxidoreductase [Amycolatopsis jiangsuensis]|uniref:NAD(P)-dependent dehydrogenase (Short-subunit alcohol dehydrogenase family) n=1 Tax=Amycolatopsis jiangsuensis TaxID=1181879 RepID=A0A840J3T7_9PSEU|nr:oxidoreductase [Amycolatopsis jiangsuensis]MBB4688285.1 NAD(P)-dependent dehydrogenase (short-subunit alcohol dehydrogenase family) [Amycolatopsis jiangsuensis]
MSWSSAEIPEQSGRVAVITGANGGLGLATAQALAAKGAHVVMAARNEAKAAAARDRIIAAVPDASLEIVRLDLGSLASVGEAAGKILAVHPALDLLIANAGVMATPEGRTADGFETQLGVNHLGHWALTAHLLPALVRTAGARVVTVTSGAQHLGRALDPADPFGRRRDYDPWRPYTNSKLANRHFSQGLDRQFRAAGLSARALTAHPGATNSDLHAVTAEAGVGGALGTFFRVLARRAGMSPERGALSQLRAATDPRAGGGTMYGPRWSSSGSPVRRRLHRPGTDAAIRSLWQVSRQLTGVDVDVTRVVAQR